MIIVNSIAVSSLKSVRFESELILQYPWRFVCLCGFLPGSQVFSDLAKKKKKVDEFQMKFPALGLIRRLLFYFNNVTSIDRLFQLLILERVEEINPSLYFLFLE